MGGGDNIVVPNGDFRGDNRNFLECIITGNETWVRNRTPETKRDSKA